MKAVVYQNPSTAIIATNRPIPPLRDHYILVKVAAVALNPTDWKHFTYDLCPDGCLLGVDYAGTIEALGPAVSKPFAVGDRVAGFVHGGNTNNKEDGAFAEYILAKENTTIKIPDAMSFEHAATLGCGVTTVGQGLFEEGYGFGLPFPPSSQSNEAKGLFVLVYGGSAATGSLAIQFLKAAGYSVITTCSPRNMPFVKAMGAVAAFDYADADCRKNINAYTSNTLRYAFDCISSEETAKICAEALTSGPGAHYGTILGPDFPRQDVVYTNTTAYVGIGEDFDKYGESYKGNETHGEFQMRWWEEARTLLENGKVIQHPVSVRDDGFEGVLQGLEDMKEGRYNAEKIVCRIGSAV